MAKHAVLSPSGASRWMACPGSVALTRDLPDTSSAYADEGTAAHELSALCLTDGGTAKGYVGRILYKDFAVDEEMADNAQKYVDYVQHIRAVLDGDLMVEQRLPLTQITGEEDAFGTGDAVILDRQGIVVVDLKYGMGNRVEAERNPQLMIYALATYHEYGTVEDFKTVQLVIHQPRLNHVSEWTCSVGELLAFGEEVKAAAHATTQRFAPLIPGAVQCQWCKARANCSALNEFVSDALGGDFEDLSKVSALDDVAKCDNTALGVKMEALELVEYWVKAVRERVMSLLNAGENVPGYKLVQGRKGSRAWSDPIAAESAMKAMRLKVDEMYDFKLISPTTAEELLKETPKRWLRLQGQVTQSEGKPSVAPIKDKRPAIVVDSGFKDLT